ncbi:MAG: hypothetical protein FVQ79_12720 [Planctomycetes bacterium]|nr:hypothetical protein [Planctomycetota bacterium]
MVINIRNIGAVKGSVYDLPHAMSLPDNDCQVLLVSRRTLYFIQLFAEQEMKFVSRYAEEFVGYDQFIIAQSEADKTDISNIVNGYFLEVVPVTCDLVAELQNLTLAINSIAGSDCASCGTEVDPAGAPPPTIGPGEDFPTLNDFEVYKCEAVNWLLDALIDIFTKLDAYDVAFWTTTTVATGSALITALVATTLVAGILPIVAGAVVAMVVALIAGATIDIEGITNVLVVNRADLTCILFDGANADASKANFLSALTVLGLNGAETGLMSLILPFNVVNNLYELNPEIQGHTITDACTGCGADCGLFFGKSNAGVVRGTGDLTKDGATRTLSSVFDPVANFHYVTVNVSDLGDGVSLFVTCSFMAASCVGTNNENWDFQPLSVSGFTDAGSSGTRCIDGDHTVMWTGSPPAFGVTKQVSWFEYISTTAFTLDCQMTQRP